MNHVGLRLALGLFASACAVQCANPIQIENALPGDPTWALTNPELNNEIEGYASLTSVNAGGSISFSVSTVDKTYQIDIYRMGWYNGAGARHYLGPIQQNGIHQPNPVEDEYGMLECLWQQTYTLSVPSTWLSGFYLAKLTGVSGKQSYIIFVVRNDSRTGNLLFQSAVTTWQAYNNWGGMSSYTFDSPNGVSVKVSFNRPYGKANQEVSLIGVGAGEFLENFQLESRPPGWEYNMVRFLEREGYDVSYLTDVDTHENGNLLLNHTGIMMVGHDEYWTWPMRTNITNARDAGVNLAFFSANNCYWQMRFETSPATGQADRTEVVFKGSGTDPVTGMYTSDLFRTLGYPEEAFIGTEYYTDPVEVPLTVVDASHWIFAGTGITNGQQFPGLVGYECDSVHGSQPSNTIILGTSPIDATTFDVCNMTIYTAPSGANVFAAGSIYFSWGLDDDFHSPALRPSISSPAIQQMVRNLLGSFTPVGVAISIQPTSGTLTPLQTQQFTPQVSGATNTGVTWSINPTTTGSITTGGLYTAPSTITSVQSVTVTATSVADTTKSASAVLTLNPPTISVTVTPTGAQINGGQQQQFAAAVSGSTNTGVTWTSSPVGLGSISSTGVYTAPGVVAATQSVTIQATSVADTTKSGSVLATLIPVGVSVGPPTASLYAGQTALFSATVSGTLNTAVTWTLTPLGAGTISTAGLYTAPSSISAQQVVTVTATSTVDTTKMATASVTLNVIGVSVSPPTASLSASQSAAFTATVLGTTNTGVTWSISPAGMGTIVGGQYTAPGLISASQVVTVTATSVVDTTRSGNASVTLIPVGVSVTPTTVTLGPSQTQQFSSVVTGSSNTGVTWSVTPSGTGSISTGGFYTAPSSVTTQQTVTIRATSSADNTKSAAASVTLTPAVQSFPNGYTYQRTLTINHTMVPNTDQSNFPVLFSGTYSYLANIANGGHVNNASGYDIVVASDSAGAHPLNWELEKYTSTTGAIAMWIQVPLVSHTSDTTVYLFYGNKSVSAFQGNKSGTWDANYAAVYHLSDNAATKTVADSTSHALTGTAAANTSTKTATGEIGGALTFNGTSDDVSNTSSTFSITGNVTMEAWINVTTLPTSGNQAYVMGRGYNGSDESYFLRLENNGGTTSLEAGTFSFPNSFQAQVTVKSFTAGWHHVVGSYDGHWNVYVDSVKTTSTQTQTPLVTNEPFVIGTRDATGGHLSFLKGIIDEVRVSNIARSADWITAEYNNQHSPATFYTLGAEQ